MPASAPKFAIGDNVTALIKGRVTAVTEYANGCYSYRITGSEPSGDRYHKFIDEQFVVPERVLPAGGHLSGAMLVAENDNDIPLPAALLQRAA